MLFLALRHLRSRMRQTLLTLTGIVLGTAAYVAISGMMLGFQSFIIDQLVNNDSHVRVTAREEWIEAPKMKTAFFQDQDLAVHWLAPPSGRRDNSFILNPAGWMERLNKDSSVFAFSPQLNIQVLATRAGQSRSARMIGSDSSRQNRVTNIEKHMQSGSFSNLGQSGNRVIVGEGLAKTLGSRMGDSIQISTSQSAAQPFKIAGIFRLGVRGIDDTTMFAALADTQKINGTPSRISDIAIRLTDVEQAGAMASYWNSTSPDKVQSWDQANEGIMSVFTTQDIVRNSMTVSIILVACFGIYNILNMSVNHKRREIAILRSMGYLPRQVTNLFLAQGYILGLVGGIAGCVLGYLICVYMSTIEVSGNRGMGGNRMMIVFFPSIYVKAFAMAVFSSAVASFLPARAAGRLEPIDIIRNEDVS